ncbi:hypothetical protein MRX96_015211 [Rhipicephalus microplus]
MPLSRGVGDDSASCSDVVDCNAVYRFRLDRCRGWYASQCSRSRNCADGDESGGTATKVAIPFGSENRRLLIIGARATPDGAAAGAFLEGKTLATETGKKRRLFGVHS